MTDESSKVHVERQVYEGANEGKLTRKDQAKRHCARFWWIYAIAFAAVVLIVVLPIVYVGYPNLAQKNINKSQLDVTSQSILAPGPDSFDLSQTTVFLSNRSSTADLAEWTGDLCINEKCSAPFARLEIPATKAANGTVVRIDKQRVQIANTTQFDQYVNLTLKTEHFNIYLKGRGGLDKGKLPSTTVKYNKRITLQGLNGLAGFNVTDLGILTTPLPDGSNTNGTALVPNPTNSTFEMGNLTMTMSVNGSFIGTAQMHDITLVPGNNTFPMTAITNQSAVVGLILGPYKSTGIIPVDIICNSTIFNGQHIPWYEHALESLPMRVDLNIVEALQRAGLAGYLGLPPGPNSNSTARLA